MKAPFRQACRQFLYFPRAFGSIGKFGILRDRHQVGDPALLQEGAQAGVLAELLVGGEQTQHPW
ncbi:hypothetical protein [Streptomyces sp. NBC_01483]|uniref:hypothetical protein n=1 Tax=Streptomyces sp. NBC_01483 TaxID=2903883 RepID=UPI002E31D03F|nr:hypothetical protein [Streptomyces sp. NBC_01483]